MTAAGEKTKKLALGIYMVGCHQIPLKVLQMLITSMTNVLIVHNVAFFSFLSLLSFPDSHLLTLSPLCIVTDKLAGRVLKQGKNEGLRL